jgi:MFS family permease
MSDTPAIKRSIGPIGLMPGVLPSQIAIFLVVILLGITILGFMNLIQPYVLSEMLHIPKGEQGRLIGDLFTVQQIGLLVFIVIGGNLADVFGRKAILILGLVGYTATCLIYPVLTVIWGFYLIRFVFGASNAGLIAGGQTMMIDYPDNASRGKFIGLILITQGIASAVLIGGLAAHVPGWLQASGMPAKQAGLIVFAVAALFGVIGICLALLLKEPHARRTGQSTTMRASIARMAADLAAVFAEARRNPRLGLVLIMGCVTRSDLNIIQGFLSLWVVSAGRDAGVETTRALATAGLMTAIIQVSTVAVPGLFGLVADRFDRSRVLVFCCGASGLALLSTAFVHDVFGIAMIGVVTVIGFTEGAQSVATNAALGQEAPAHLRGSVVGVFVLLGSVSVILVSFVGGRLFDSVGYVAPFVLVGILNAIFTAAAVVIMGNRSRRPKITATE